MAFRHFIAALVVATADYTATVDLLHPIHFSSVPLSNPGKASLEDNTFGKRLAEIGLEGYKNYMKSTLPQELEKDPRFKKKFMNQDHSRVNDAFRRWQKRAFADKIGADPLEFTGKGELAPRLDGIEYQWDKLYDNDDFRRLNARITQFAKLYMQRTGYKQIPRNFRIFVWVDVFNKGDAAVPFTATSGSFVSGRYWASAKSHALKQNFEDPRGINPPYGKTFSHVVYEGNLVMYPSWSSTFITPNMQNFTTVCFSFTVYPVNKTDLMHWKDDLTGALVIPRKVKLPNLKKPF